MRLLLGGSWRDLEVELALRNISLDLATRLALDRYALGSVSLARSFHSASRRSDLRCAASAGEVLSRWVQVRPGQQSRRTAIYDST